MSYTKYEVINVCKMRLEGCSLRHIYENTNLSQGQVVALLYHKKVPGWIYLSFNVEERDLVEDALAYRSPRPTFRRRG